MRRLIIRPGAIGDFVVSLPALEYLRRDAGHLEIWCAGSNTTLAPFADRTRSIAATGLDRLELGGDDIVPELRIFDDILSWYGSNRAEFRDRVSALGLPFRFLRALPPEGCEMHAVDFYLEQVGAPAGAMPRIPCPVADRGDFAVIHPFSGSAKKNWPLDHFQELARRLPMAVRWCAGPEDDLPGAVRIPDLYNLACWLATARVFIGNDSGIAHLAAAAGTPSVVVLFGPSDPRVWGPRGQGVRIVRSGSSMAGISVEQVLNAVNRP